MTWWLDPSIRVPIISMGVMAWAVWGCGIVACGAWRLWRR